MKAEPSCQVEAQIEACIPEADILAIKVIEIASKKYDLRHLKAFAFRFDALRTKNVNCYVQFSTHCYSDRYDPLRHAHNFVVVDQHGAERCFDLERYALSLQLPSIIQQLPGSNVFQTYE